MSVTVTSALRAPLAVGVKITVMVHELCLSVIGGMVVGAEGQLLVWLKSPLSAPVIVMPLMAKLSAPVFASVMA